MAGSLDGKRVAFLATEMFEQVELTEPWEALQEAGARVELLSIRPGEIQGFNHYDKADKFPVDRTVDAVSVEDYDALVLPGGVGNPDTLRTNEGAVGFVRDFFDAGKPIGAICHAPWMLVETAIADGRTLTSFPSLKTDIRNAGGSWVDEEVVVDEGVVTSRDPDDLPAFCRALIEEFAEGKHDRAPVSEKAARSAS